MSEQETCELANWAADISVKYSRPIMLVIMALTGEADKYLDIELAKVAVIASFKVVGE